MATFRHRDDAQSVLGVGGVESDVEDALRRTGEPSTRDIAEYRRPQPIGVNVFVSSAVHFGVAECSPGPTHVARRMSSHRRAGWSRTWPTHVLVGDSRLDHGRRHDRSICTARPRASQAPIGSSADAWGPANRLEHREHPPGRDRRPRPGLRQDPSGVRRPTLSGTRCVRLRVDCEVAAADRRRMDSPAVVAHRALAGIRATSLREGAPRRPQLPGPRLSRRRWVQHGHGHYEHARRPGPLPARRRSLSVPGDR